MEYSVVFSLGSNLGDRMAHLVSGIKSLQVYGSWTAISRVYETDPVGMESKHRFMNMAAILRTNIPAGQWKEIIHKTEADSGRLRTGAMTDRTLDIDILFFLPQEVLCPGIDTPHPRMFERAFVLKPLETLIDNIDDEHMRVLICKAAAACSNNQKCNDVGEIPLHSH